MSLTKNEVDALLVLDYEAEAKRIGEWLRESLRSKLHRRGLVVAISGGIDSFARTSTTGDRSDCSGVSETAPIWSQVSPSSSNMVKTTRCSTLSELKMSCSRSAASVEATGAKDFRGVQAAVGEVHRDRVERDRVIRR